MTSVKPKHPIYDCNVCLIDLHSVSGQVVAISLSSIDQLRASISDLGPDECDTTGTWTNGQIYFHLASAFEASIEGLPSGYPRTVRWAVRPLRWIVTSVRFPPWLPIPARIAYKLDPPATVDCAAQYHRLLDAIDRFTEYEDDLPAHPVLGKLTRSEWIGFHLRHCEHHLRFIVSDSTM